MIAIVLGLLGWRLLGVWVGVLIAVGLAVCWSMGLWPETMSTFALVITSTCLALLLGLPLGVLAGLLPKLDHAVEPILDLIQTLPPYIYLLPAIALLGFGPATALARDPDRRHAAGHPADLARHPQDAEAVRRARAGDRHDRRADVLQDPPAVRACRASWPGSTRA